MKKKDKEKFLYETAELLRCGILIRDLPQFLSKVFQPEREKIEKLLLEGKTLSEIFGSIDGFTKEEKELIRISEETGRIAETFQELYETEKDMKELNSKLLSFLMYPVFMLIMITAYMFFSVNFMVPMMADLLRTMDIREGLLFTIDDIRLSVNSHIHIILPVFLITAFFIVRYLKKISFHLRIVMGKDYRRFLEMNFISSLEKLMSGGMNIVKALELQAECPHYDIKKLTELLSQGNKLSDAFEKSGFSKELSQLVRINEESGDIGRGLRVYTEKTGRMVKITMENRVKLLEPISLILIGSVMVVTILSVMGPLMQGMSKIT